MSRTVDERVVEMRFDNRQFEDGVHESIDSLKDLDKALEFKDADRGLRGLQNATSSFDTSPMQKAVQGVTESFQRLESAGLNTIDNLINRFASMGERMVKQLSVDQISAGFNKFGEKTGSVATLVSQGYALEEVNEQLDKLVKFTDETSYNFTDMVSNISKFTAAGQGLEDSTNAMEGIALWAALSGQNAGTASRAMYQLSQAMGKGALRYDDYKSIQNANMDTQEFRHTAVDTAEALGVLKKNADETFTLLEGEGKGKQFTFQEMFSSDALTRTQWFSKDVMMEVFKKYSGAAQEVFAFAEENDMMVGEVLEKYADQFDEFGIKALKAGQEARTFKDVIDATADAASTSWMVTFENIIGNYEQATKIYTAMAEAMWDIFIGEAGERRNEILKLWHDGIDGISGYEAALEGLANIWSGISGIFTAIGGAFENTFWDDVETAAQRLISWSVSFRDATAKFRDAFPVLDWMEEAGDAIEEFNDDISSVREGVEETIAPISALSETIEDLAKRTLGGEFGTGETRFSMIDALIGEGGGHAVQNRINEMMGVAFRYEDAMTVMADGTKSAMDDISKALEESSIDWAKYAGADWIKDGKFDSGFVDDIDYYVDTLKQSSGWIADTLATDYKLTTEDTLLIAEALDTLTAANEDAELTIEDYGNRLDDALSASGIKWSDYGDKVLDENGQISESFKNGIISIAESCDIAEDSTRELTKAIVHEFGLGYKDSQKLADMMISNVDTIMNLVEQDEIDKAAETRMTNIYNIFAGLFSAIDIGKKTIAAFGRIFVNTIKGIAQIVAPAADSFLQMAGDIGLSVVELDKLWTAVGKFDDIANSVVDNIVAAVQTLYDWLGRVRGYLSVDPRIEHFTESLGKLWTYMKQLAGLAWQSITKAFQNVFTDILGDHETVDTAKLFADAIGWLAEKVADLIDLILQHAPSVIEFFGTFTESLAGTIRDIAGALAGIWNMDGGPMAKLMTMWETFTTKLSELNLDPAKKNMQEQGQGLLDVLSEQFEGFDLGKLLQNLKTGGLIAIFAMIAKLIYSITHITDAPQGFLDGIKDILEGITGSLTAFQTNIKADIILKIAKAVGILAFSFAALTFVDQDALTNVIANVSMFGLIVALILGILVKLKGAQEAAKNPYEAITKALNTFLDGMKKALSKAASMIGLGMMAAGFGIAVLLFVISLSKLNDIPWGEFAQNGIKLLLVLGSIIGAMIIVSKYANQVTIGSAAGILAMGVALSMIGNTIAVMATVGDSDKLQAASNALFWIGLLMGALSKLSVGNQMISLAAGMMIFAATLPVFALGFMMFSLVDWGSALIGSMVLGAIAAGMVFLSQALDASKVPVLLQFAGAMVALSGGLFLLGLLPSEKVMTVAASIGVLVAAMAGFSLIANPAALNGIWLALTGIGTAAAGLGAGLLLGAMAIGVFAGALPKVATGLADFGKVLKERGSEVLLGFVALLGMAITAGVAVLIASQPALIAGITSLITTALGALTASIPAVLTTLNGVLIAVGVFIIGATPGLIAMLFQVVVNIIDGLATAIDTQGQALLDAIGHLIDSIVDFIGHAIDTMFGGIPGKIMEGIADIGNKMEGFVEGIPILGDVYKTVDGWFSKDEIANATAETVDEAVTDGVQRAGGVGGGSKFVKYNQKFTVSDPNDLIDMDSVRAAGGAIPEEVEAGAESGFANVGTSFQTMFGDMFGNFDMSSIAGNFGTNFETSFGPELLGSLETMKESALPVVETGTQELGDEVVDTLGEATPKIEKKGDEAVTAYSNKISQSSRPTTAAHEMGNKVVAASDITERMYSAGENAIQGFINGFRSKFDEVDKAVDELTAKTVIRRSEENLQEHSPSRIMHKIGAFVSMGFANGISDFGYLADDATTELTDRTVETMQDVVSRINDALTDDATTPTLRPVLDMSNVDSGLNRINTSFNAQRVSLAAASMEINNEYSQLDALVDMTAQIFRQLQNGQDLYLDENILAGRINRRLGLL